MHRLGSVTFGAFMGGKVGGTALTLLLTLSFIGIYITLCNRMNDPYN